MMERLLNKIGTKLNAALVAFLTLLLLSGCGVLSEEPSADAVDTGAIVQQVVAELNQPNARPLTTVSDSNQTLTAGDLSLEAQLMALYHEANPSVVYIVTQRGTGSGFVYDSAGHIVTNNHVVSGARNINRTDYGVSIPSVPFVASVDEELALELDLVAVAT